MTQPSAPDPFEFLKMLWSPMGLPMPGMVTPTLDVNELDKRIAELHSVENWLNLNLNLLRMSIQGLEMQKATLSAMQGMQQAAASGPQAAAWPAQQAAAAAGPAAGPSAGPAVGTTAGPSANPAAPGTNPFADAWWSVLQNPGGTSDNKPK